MKTSTGTNKRPDSLADLMTLAVAIAVLLVPAFLEPGDSLLGVHTRLHLPPCLFHLITGVPCPLCGMTTSFSLLLHGRPARAFLAHPAGPLVYLAILALTVFGALSRLERVKRPTFTVSSWYWGLGLAVLWILRIGAWLAVR